MPPLPRTALRRFRRAKAAVVLVDDKPIRASKKSAQWCLTGVDACWKSKERFYKPAEKEEAKAAYDHAREVYRKIVEESDVD